jgi:type II restriction/modification system DNA methylase subunit YeeA
VQIEEPLDKLKLEELPERWGPLSFLFPVPEKPVFKNNQEEVTRDAADRLATLFNKLVVRKDVGRKKAQRFVLQCLVALFAEDIGLLPKYFFARLLEECDSSAKAYDLIGGLFKAMNTPGGVKGGRYKGVDYFNGGLFAEPVEIELSPDELNQLKKAAESNWKAVRPEIFGTIFEHSLGAEKRHAFGAHFTSGVDIMKIIRPTIIEPWEQLIDQALAISDAPKRRKRLLELQEQLAHVRVLDPACGSGNFLYLAYRSMKRLERRILDAIRGKEARYGLVNASQFYGMDIQPFAVELAKVTMMIARKLAIDELHIQEQALPLDNLDANFVIGDALITFPKQGEPFRTP